MATYSLTSKSASLSNTFFDRSCCTMPIIMFAITTGKNVRLLNEPAAITRTAKSAKMALK